MKMHPYQKLVIAAVCVLCFVTTAPVAPAADDAKTAKALMPSQHVSVFKKYCFDCHDSQSQEGGVDLQAISLEVSKDIETAEKWQKILNAINSGEMPPEDSEPISDVDKTGFLDDLSTQMVVARKILSDTGGVITMRRLNRREYQNTIESLLGIRPDVSTLPDDQATSGFDTLGASLFFSSDQLEQYLETAKTTLKLALRSPDPVHQKTRRVEPEDELTPHYAAAAEELRERSARAEAFMAQTEKPASDFGFLDAYQAKKQVHAEWLPLLDEYLARPETKTGATLIMTIKQGGTTKVKLPTLGEHDEGEYVIRVRAAAYPDAAERFHYLEFTSGLSNGRSLLGWRKVTGTLDDPQVIEFPITHQAGEKQNIWIHQRTHQDRGDKNLATIDMKRNGVGTPPGLWVDWAELDGPLPDLRRNEVLETVLFEKPDQWSEEEYAKEVLSRFAQRAFRGEEPDAEFLERLVARYAANRAQGQKRTEALIGPLAIILASPSFLYMVESTGNEDSQRLTENELAVRLSYFLWSAPPDEELLALARRGTLSEPAILQSQTSRLLADERADRFVEGFVHQWLQMERLDMFQFMGAQFPTFDNAVRECARQEIFHTVQLMLDEALPLGTLLKSDFVVINDLLAGYYGIPNVEGHAFRKVKLPPDSLRGGLLGSAAVLAMGSDGLRTSPVERGAWILRHLINDPPPPAPPNVPQLGRLAGEVLSARELARAHQEEPQCAQCHRKIDPLGFGLENFDASGQWRDLESVRLGKRRDSETRQFAIDSSGRLPGGQVFDDYFGLRDAVADHADDFARGFTEALIEYGLGRPFGFTDEDLANEMIAAAKPHDYELNRFIHALVQSEAFRTK